MRSKSGAALTLLFLVNVLNFYDRLALAVERAAATMHMRGHDSTAFAVEDTKCVALWDRIRAKMPK